MSTHILVVDDDPQIRDVVRIALCHAGYDVSEAQDGIAGLAAARATGPDLVVLDIGMPEMTGLDVCRRLRNDSDLPILFLTAHSDEVDRIVGLELGADDYVSKPFSPRELVARVRAILKRSNGSTTSTAGLKRGRLAIDKVCHTARVGTKDISLTSREMEILTLLMVRPEHVLSRRALVDQVYGTSVHVSDRTLDSHLRNLRAKLSKAGCPDAIETVHGIGIRMGACQGG